MTSVSPGDAAAAQAYAASQAANQGFTSQSAEFFLQNYRLGKTLGIGSFGKVWPAGRQRRAKGAAPPPAAGPPPPPPPRPPLCLPVLWSRSRWLSTS